MYRHEERKKDGTFFLLVIPEANFSGEAVIEPVNLRVTLSFGLMSRSNR